MAVDRQHEPGQYPNLGGCSQEWGPHEGSPLVVSRVAHVAQLGGGGGAPQGSLANVYL